MNAKLLEIRDDATRIAAVAIHRDGGNANNPAEHWLFDTEGYGPQSVLLARLSDGEGHIDAWDWKFERPMRVVHLWLEEHFGEVHSGDVVDARVILGERAEPVESDRFH